MGGRLALEMMMMMFGTWDDWKQVEGDGGREREIDG